jgi:ornithine carbamoyltransferase
MNHFITLKDLPKSEIINLIHRSIELKKNGHTFQNAFRGRTLTMLFSKPSTRTRVSAETGWNSYGGSCLFLGKNDGQWGKESLRDTATVISSMADAILVRCGAHSEIEEICKYSAVPVINALSDLYHPLQMLADLVTLQETYNTLDGVSVAWIGDSNNILNSWLVTAPRLGIRMSVATPEG